MTDNYKNNKRIAKNTLMLYSRQILIFFASLYTTRVVLDVLGVDDFGISGVVGGLVGIFSFLGASMASASSRFFAFALGKEDESLLKKTFSVNLFLYVSVALIAVLLLETVGLWFVYNKLNIPTGRFDAAVIIYHFMVISFTLDIIKIPFTSLITAHEDFHIYTYVSVLEAVMKVVAALLLQYLPGDKLILNGFLFLIATILYTAIYFIISFKRYSECQFRKIYWDINVLREIFSFTWWTLFGQLSTAMRSQAIIILVNQFFNPAIVAAQNLSRTVSNYIGVFSSNFNASLYPPIVKEYANNNKEYSFSLVYNGSKLTFFLMWIVALPFFLEMDVVLSLWLKDVPEHTVLFTRLVLIESLISSVSMPIVTLARAPGKMRLYESVLGSMQIATFFITWIVLYMGAAAYSVYIVAIATNILMFFVRLVIVRYLTGINLREFYKRVLVPLALITVLSALPSFAVHKVLPKGLLFSSISVIIGVVISSVCMYYIGLSKQWRNKVKIALTNKLKITDK